MSLIRLWWKGVARPGQAFLELKSRPAPAWGFWVVLTFNLLISATSLPALYLLGRPLFLESWLTFLPSEGYLLYEIFFLPPLRLLVWLMGAAVIHVGLRLVKQASDYDTLLNIGGLEYLVTMPFILLSDWILIAVDAYWLAEYSHPLAALWGLILTVIGLKKCLGAGTGRAVFLALLSSALTIPLLAIFAR